MAALVAELEQKNAEKDAQLKAQSEMFLQEREQHDKLNQELLQKLEETSLQKDATCPVVSLGKAKYRVVIPKFQIGTDFYEAKDLKSNSELLKVLVEKKSGVLEHLDD